MRQGRGHKHIPTEQSRKFVEEMVAGGIKEERIARVLDLHEVTMRRYYRQEIDKGAIKMDHLVSRSLAYMAAGGPEGDWKQAIPACTIFYCKTRMGYRAPDPWDDERDEQGHRTIRVINSPESTRLDPPRPASADRDGDDLDLQ
jgi:hypothetical protein